jgi:hypothetical protein
MTDRETRLYEAAKAKHGEISPCGGAATWDGCFTEVFGDLMIWFDLHPDWCKEQGTSCVLTERMAYGAKGK